MTQALAIAAGGAIGALLRYWASTGVHAWLGRGFPYGTLFVNVLGSLLMGFLYIWLLERMAVSPVVRAFLLIGVLGAFTTFSTFSMETLELLEKRDILKAVLNMFLNVGLCVLAAWIGVILARAI